MKFKELLSKLKKEDRQKVSFSFRTLRGYCSSSTINRVLKVCFMVAECSRDGDIVAACLLKELLQMGKITLGWVLDNLGWGVVNILEIAAKYEKFEGRVPVAVMKEGAKIVALRSVFLLNVMYKIQALEEQVKNGLTEAVKTTEGIVNGYLIHVMELDFELEKVINLSVSKIVHPDAVPELERLYLRGFPDSKESQYVLPLMSKKVNQKIG